MLSPEMVKKLNHHLNLEFFSSNLYLQMSAWCNDKGFEGAAAFLQNHAKEEMDHMQRFFNYISDSNALPLIGELEAPPHQFNSLGDLFSKSFEHEQFVSQRINQLAHDAFEKKDLFTFNFLQWFIAEQLEEEKLFKSILDKIELIGEDGKALFFIDRELAEMAKQPAGSVA